ncbi:MAG TPA: hypothetical protein VFY06_13955 [Verrucomicrobiae bacterium]|nr:hypothetical protein [Verrucomicrobiae bacterium]
MKEIIELNKRIMIEAPGVIPRQDEGDCLFVSRDRADDTEVNQLPPAIKTDLDALCERLNAVIPNDFNYCLCLGNYDPRIMLEFCDGAMARASCPEEFDPNISLFDQLAKVDWAKHRTFGMAGSQFFDGLRELSDELEPELPATSEIQKDFRVELEAFAKAKRRGKPGIYHLTWREDDGVKEKSCVSMKDLRGDLCDLMTCGYKVIGIIVDNKLLPPRKVDKIKLAVLKDMKETMPISYVRALDVA